MWKFWHLPHWLIIWRHHLCGTCNQHQRLPLWAWISILGPRSLWESFAVRDHLAARHLRQRFATANIIAVIANGLPIGSPLLPFRWSALGAGWVGHDRSILGNFACHPPSPIANGLLIYAFAGDHLVFARQSDMLSAMGKSFANLPAGDGAFLRSIV